MRLIDADKLEELCDIMAEKCGGIGESIWNQFRTTVECSPTIEAEPVIHAKWIFSPDHSEGECTNCNFKIYGRPYQNTYLIVPYNYCPNCGAKMEVDDGTLV